LQDLLVRLDRPHKPDVVAIVERAVRTGIFDGSPAGRFTTAFFHARACSSMRSAPPGLSTSTFSASKDPVF
jgi:hypothetical protein